MSLVCWTCAMLFKDRKYEGGVLTKAGAKCPEHPPISKLTPFAICDEHRPLAIRTNHDPGDEDRS